MADEVVISATELAVQRYRRNLVQTRGNKRAFKTGGRTFENSVERNTGKRWYQSRRSTRGTYVN